MSPTRAQRRAASRDQARRDVRYNGPPPRYVPVRAPECAEHHRKVPCRRCQPEEV